MIKKLMSEKDYEEFKDYLIKGDELGNKLEDRLTDIITSTSDEKLSGYALQCLQYIQEYKQQEIGIMSKYSKVIKDLYGCMSQEDKDLYVASLLDKLEE